MPSTNPSSPFAGASDSFDMDAFTKELNRLSEVNRALLGGEHGTAGEAAAAEADELALLREENEELRGQLREYEQLLTAGGPTEESWSDRQREYEALLEEKSEVIRSLHLRLQDMQEGGAHAAAGAPFSADDLQRQQAELEEERRRLAEDEEAMTTQMREMEMALSRDRADLARQRQEVQRLLADFNRDVEMANRDSGLQDRLKSMRRLPEPAKSPAASAADARPQSSSGLIRRIFG